MLSLYLHDPSEAGTDEAGRGCLAGPVTAAAVILPGNIELQGLDDSKKLSQRERAVLRPMIEEQAISFGVHHIFPKEIDRVNILNASIAAMHGALQKLSIVPPYILVDGNQFKPFGVTPFECIVKGDAKFLSIAAASVLAKTYRDSYMEDLHAQFPVYNWKRNKGYPTREHREAIRQFGSSPYHRKSFRLLPEQVKFDF